MVESVIKPNVQKAPTFSWQGTQQRPMKQIFYNRTVFCLSFCRRCEQLLVYKTKLLYCCLPRFHNYKQWIYFSRHVMHSSEITLSGIPIQYPVFLYSLTVPMPCIFLSSWVIFPPDLMLSTAVELQWLNANHEKSVVDYRFVRRVKQYFL